VSTARTPTIERVREFLLRGHRLTPAVALAWRPPVKRLPGLVEKLRRTGLPIEEAEFRAPDGLMTVEYSIPSGYFLDMNMARTQRGEYH